MQLLILGYKNQGQMGHYLGRAAQSLGVDYEIVDLALAEASNKLVQKFYWSFRGKKPAHSNRFARQVLDLCDQKTPPLILTTGGRVPLGKKDIETLQRLGATVANYSTDDPWNEYLKAPWFVTTLACYDIIFTPRRENIEDFRRSGVRKLSFLPFGYDPDTHRPWSGQEDRCQKKTDIVFVGGCDEDRIPFIEALIDAGISVSLFGRYWADYRKTRPYSRNVGTQENIRAATASAAMSLCLVRRANRDGHVMRSFEAAYIGGCILAEDTQDHREIFGEDESAARYFRSPSELVKTALDLLPNVSTRTSMANALKERMAGRSDAYADRLREIIRLSQSQLAVEK
jgi:spore maturation protein CgeB